MCVCRPLQVRVSVVSTTDYLEQERLFHSIIILHKQATGTDNPVMGSGGGVGGGGVCVWGGGGGGGGMNSSLHKHKFRHTCPLHRGAGIP